MDFTPQTDLIACLRKTLPQQKAPWDKYFLTMAETDVLQKKQEIIGVKSHFVRNIPFKPNGAFALLGGITDFVRTVNDLELDDPELLSALQYFGFKQPLIDYCKRHKRLSLEIYAPPEGNLFFDNEPIISYRGPLPDIRLAEGIVTEAVNFASLALTKWSRVVQAASPAIVLEFARRRAQNSRKASLYALLAGCYGTSNMDIAMTTACQLMGTMGHEAIQSTGNVALAFDEWLSVQPDKPIGLVDTLQCLEQDFPLWLDAVYKHRDAIKNANPPIWGWRNDSGDLAALSISQYRMFCSHPLAQDSWFVERLRVILSNELDEYVISAIKGEMQKNAQYAGFTAQSLIEKIIWAAGTKPGTCEDQPSVGGVSKLMAVNDKARIKLALDSKGDVGLKTSIPGFNFSALVCNQQGEIVANLIYPAKKYTVEKGKLLCRSQETPPHLTTISLGGKETNLSSVFLIPQQRLVYDSLLGNGYALQDQPTIESVPQFIKSQLKRLPWENKRLSLPQEIPTLLTKDLYELRRRMIHKFVLAEEDLILG